MRIFVVILLLPFCLKAQLFTETFSNFFPDTSAGNIIAAYVMDETNYPGTGTITYVLWHERAADKNAAIRVYASLRVRD